MLTITQVNYIRELYFREGKTITEIRSMTGKNYRTVKKYIEMDDFNEKSHKAKRPNKSDVLRPIIREWLIEDKARHRKQRHTATRIFERLSEEHSDILEVSARTVRTLVREERENIFGGNKAYLRLEHPGGEAQVDFGEFRAYENGTLKVFHELILSFPASNAGFMVCTRSQTREALLEGLVALFKEIEHVPSAIWFDQMSSAALRTRDDQGRLRVANMVERFRAHYGFEIKFCNANSGHEKGSVENKVGTLRRNLLVPEPVIDDLTAFNRETLTKCHKRNQKEHYLIKKPISELFEKEQALMTPITHVAFDTSRYESRRVNKYGLVEFSGCRYSANPRCVGQLVKLKIEANKVTILSQDMLTEIAVHPRLFETGKESIHHIDFIDIVKTRPKALKYSGIYKLLPESWQNYLPLLEKEEQQAALNVLKMILIEKDLDFADRVLRESLQHQCLSPDGIAITYKRLIENRAVYDVTMDLSHDLPTYQLDLQSYDQLMGGDHQ